ncbi:MAG: CheR family methyltransferase [Spirochaetia bacterium]|nr:CheR family methyltransferase [Spirochaetia bacterium]
MNESDINRVGSHISDARFKRLSAFIEKEIGIKMPDTKRSMIESRLQKRLRVLHMKSLDQYIDSVFSGNDVELVHMINVITTNKTDFWREPDHFDLLVSRLLPTMRLALGENHSYSFWSAGCATGEEPYTLAMVLEEYGVSNPGFNYRIVASDISTSALDVALSGVYQASKVLPVPLSYRKKYLLRSRDPQRDEVRVKKDLRDKISFLRLNFMDSSFPFDGVFDVIFCRNVIIYFDRPTQERLLSTMCRYLPLGGHLILGHSETLTGMNLPLHSVAPTVYKRV